MCSLVDGWIVLVLKWVGGFCITMYIKQHTCFLEFDPRKKGWLHDRLALRWGWCVKPHYSSHDGEIRPIIWPYNSWSLAKWRTCDAVGLFIIRRPKSYGNHLEWAGRRENKVRHRDWALGGKIRQVNFGQEKKKKEIRSFSLEENKSPLTGAVGNITSRGQKNKCLNDLNERSPHSQSVWSIFKS